MPEAQEPYKPHHIIQKVEIPTELENYPKNDADIVRAATYTFNQGLKEGNLLPPEYAALETWFSEVYSRQYEERAWIDVEPQALDYLYQQFGLKMDEKLGRNGINTFGLYAVSYLEGLRTMGIRQGYLGSGGWKHVVKAEYRELLLGCSSITTADGFFRFMKAVNPDATAIVTDINPLAVRLAKEALTGRQQEQIVQSDAQRIPLEDGSVDFVATNFLVPNLIDLEGSGVETIVNVLSEASRVLDPKGRLVMVEQLDRNSLQWLSHYAYKQGLTLSTGGPEGGINKQAVILSSPADFERVADRMPEFITASAKEVAHNAHVRTFNLDPEDYFGGERIGGPKNLIFEQKRRLS